MVTVLCAGAIAESGDLGDEVLRGYAANMAQLKCAHLVWRRESTIVRDDGESHQETGNYEMWWSGPKVATAYMHETMGNNPDGTFSLRKFGYRTVFDGREFRMIPNTLVPQDIGISRAPEYMLYTNWLKVANVRYENYMHGPHDLETKWEEIKREEEVVLRCTFSRPATRGRVVLTIAPGRGNQLLEEEMFRDEVLVGKGSRAVKEVAPGIWFPVTVEERSDKVHQKYSLILDRCSFNDPSDVPDSIFELPVTSGMEVTDERLGFPMEYSGALAPVLASILKPGFVLDLFFLAGGPWILGAGVLLGAFYVIRRTRRRRAYK